MTTPIEGTTPRPWDRFIDSYEDGTMFVANPALLDDMSAPPVAQALLPDDAALIVAAVNDYDRLRAIEDMARAFVTAFDNSLLPHDNSYEREVGLAFALREALR